MYRRLARGLSQFELMVTHDAGDASAHEYGVKGIPHMVIVGRDGRIVQIHHGYSEDGLDDVVADINRALTSR